VSSVAETAVPPAQSAAPAVQRARQEDAIQEPSRHAPAGRTAPPRRLHGLRAHLVALVLAVLLPALAFGVAASWEALRRQDEAEEARLVDTAQALSAAVDNLIGAKIAALRALAGSPDPDPERSPEHFLAHARSTAEIFGAWVNVHRRDGSVILSTLRPLGAELPGPRNAPALTQAFESGRATVSGVAQGRLGGRPSAYVLVPMRRGAEVQAVLAMPVLPEHLAATLRGQAASGQGSIALTDANGVFAARSREPEQVVGQPRPLRQEPLSGRSGVLRGRSLAGGVPIRTAYFELSNAPGWHIWVNEPEASFAAARRVPMLALAGGAALALAIGLAGAALITRRLLRPVEGLVAHAEAVAQGALGAEAASPVAPASVAEFERLRLAVTDAEAALRRVQRIGRVGGFEVDLRPQAGLRSSRSAEYAALHGALRQDDGHEDWLRRLHPVDRARAESHFLACVADGGGTEYEQEYRIVLPDRGVRCIYARGEIERDAAGHALRMVGAHVDITALRNAEAALRDGEERLRLALEAAQLGAWEVDLVTGRAERTARALEIFGYGTEQETAVYPSWRDRIHPEDRPVLATKVEAVRSGEAEGYVVEYRFQRPDGRWIWVESHARANGRDPLTGRPLRLIGTSQDVTTRREAEEAQAVLVHELDHRAKNTLAVVQAALRLTPRTDAESFARAVEGRVGALARAHTLLAHAGWRGADLADVAGQALAPFLGDTAEGPRATLAGPRVALGPQAVQGLSMTFHELATNAAKHGGLSTAAGRVALSWQRAGDALQITWRESGGPPVATTPEGRGFGSSLIAATISRQLGGSFRVTWRPEGLLWEAELPLLRLMPGGEATEDVPISGGAAPPAAADAQAPLPSPALAASPAP
jgi:PAS domain S-box-containing protein